MPFGAFLSGLQFLQISYLWSVELWSSILSKDFQLKRKICFTILVFICITIAVTAGPSSASLLIARQGLWPIASTYLAVNASVLDLWPDRLDDKKIERDCAIVRFDSLEHTSSCPLSELYNVLERPVGYPFGQDPHEFNAAKVQAQDTHFVTFILSPLCHSSSKDQYCATLPQAKLLDGFYLVQSSYSSMSDLEGYQSIDKDYYQPYTVVSCVADVAKDASDQTPLQFARISETDSELQKNREIVSIPGFTKGEVIKSVSEDMSAFRVDWVDLPVDIFKTGIPGAVFVSSRDANGSSYNITTCTLNAGWGSSTIMSTAREPDAIWSHMSNVPSSWTNDKAFLDAHDYVFALRPDFANISNFSYPQRRINISKDWIKSTINPTIVLNDNSTTNFISLALLSQQAGSPEAFQPTEMDWARLLNFLLVVAMAATGTGHDWEVFSDLKNATKTCDTCLVLEIKYSYYGWLYSAQGTAIRLAVTVMLVYCALILGHIIYSAVSGISSTAWDSTAELVALTMNSSPTEILQNTCAGIIGREAFQTPVRVLATTPGHLELVFGAAKGQNSKLVMNEKYGNLTAKKTTKSKSQSPLRRVRYGKRLLLGARNKGRLRKRSGAVDPYIRIDEVSPLQNSPTATAKKVKSADLTAD